MTSTKGILGEKLGMTQIFQDTRAVPVTVIKAGPCFVAQVKTTERNIYTVIRSPHKYKDSREHFQMLTHKRLIDIVDATSKTVQELQRLNLSAGVDIEIKL